MIGIKDPIEREQLTIKYWESIKNAVDEVLCKDGKSRDTDKWNECFSEACMGWVRGLNSWKPDQGATTSTYSIGCAKNRIRTWLRRTNRWAYHESTWNNKFVSKELSGEGGVVYAPPEEIYSGNRYNTGHMNSVVLPMSYMRWWNDPDMASPEKEYLFAEKLHAARKILSPLYARWDKIDRGIFNKVIIALVPEPQYLLARYYKMSQSAISRRIVKLRKILRQENL